MQFRFQIFIQLILRNAAYCYKFLAHRYVLQIIQVTEYTHFAELGHTRQHRETDITVSAFHHAIEGFQQTAVSFLQFRPTDCLQQRFIIFVYQNHNALSGFLISMPNHLIETFLRLTVSERTIIRLFPYFKIFIQFSQERFHIFISAGVQIKMQNRVSLPICLQTLDGQSGKQFFLSLEIGFQG